MCKEVLLEYTPKRFSDFIFNGLLPRNYKIVGGKDFKMKPNFLYIKIQQETIDNYENNRKI